MAGISLTTTNPSTGETAEFHAVQVETIDHVNQKSTLTIGHYTSKEIFDTNGWTAAAWTDSAEGSYSDPTVGSELSAQESFLVASGQPLAGGSIVA